MFHNILSAAGSLPSSSSFFKTSIFQAEKPVLHRDAPDFQDNPLSRSQSLQDTSTSASSEHVVRVRRVHSLSRLDDMDRRLDVPFYQEWKAKRRKSKKYTFIKVLQTIKEKQSHHQAKYPLT
ncbi:hypothetical protein CAPTEDRAFT_203059 [Capitella teleta]|uniref:Uncharacterized protein n=1 Tax=Capitella teleta TaxID=283909 RepID=R7TYC2_CAPTE|nr:hypothetical protein CAPTEDRAFT_203059 [Capitella teleta]|eukprot:ELT96421.1 hypothetical protein CAPTEDRAFT_203059 [Capitella teleta]